MSLIAPRPKYKDKKISFTIRGELGHLLGRYQKFTGFEAESELLNSIMEYFFSTDKEFQKFINAEEERKESKPKSEKSTLSIPVRA